MTGDLKLPICKLIINGNSPATASSPPTIRLLKMSSFFRFLSSKSSSLTERKWEEVEGSPTSSSTTRALADEENNRNTNKKN